MTDPTPTLSIVIPAFNERERLPPTLAELAAWREAQPFAVEIVVSDDGSTDGSTGGSIDALEREHPGVRFVRAPRNMGKGAAVARGMMAAAGELLLFSDADLSTPIDEFDAMRSALEAGGAAIAIGSRGMRESRLEIRQPLWREYSGRIFNLLVKMFSGLPFSDTQCGFKLVRREAAREIFPRMTCRGWAFDVEMLVIARELGLQTAECPVRWLNAEGSKINLLSDAPVMLRDVIGFRLAARRGAYRDPAAKPMWD